MQPQAHARAQIELLSEGSNSETRSVCEGNWARATPCRLEQSFKSPSLYQSTLDVFFFSREISQMYTQHVCESRWKKKNWWWIKFAVSWCCLSRQGLKCFVGPSLPWFLCSARNPSQLALLLIPLCPLLFFLAFSPPGPEQPAARKKQHILRRTEGRNDWIHDVEAKKKNVERMSKKYTIFLFTRANNDGMGAAEKKYNEEKKEKAKNSSWWKL